MGENGAAETPCNDQPIEAPRQDLFGIDPFACSLAQGIARMDPPRGTVVAINGAWGSGKSSTINLVRHYLKDESVAKNSAPIEIIPFACWWFRGEEALTLAFFRELSAAIPGVGKILSKITARLLKPEILLGAAINVAQGKMVDAVANLLDALFKNDETLESLHKDLSERLGKHKGRFLVIIDDIDRLSPDEALQMFRLVKSVGQLPNVIYLLAFDRDLAERIVAEKYPSEGPHYLEKIIQIWFDMPSPDIWAFTQNLRERIGGVARRASSSNAERVERVIHQVVLPEMKTPRDVIRLEAMLSLTWPAVEAEVDFADFVGLETLRLKQPRLHRAVRENGRWLQAGQFPAHSSFSDEQKNECKNSLVGAMPEQYQSRYLQGLKTIFEPLQAVLGNGVYGGDAINQWDRQRRACSGRHFNTYFRFTPDYNVLPRAERDEIIAGIGDKAFMREKLRESSLQPMRDGWTRSDLILEELARSADEIRKKPTQDIQSFFEVLFAMVDDLDSSGFSGTNLERHANLFRMSQVAMSLTHEMSVDARSDIFLNASRQASLGWRVDLASQAMKQHLTRGGNAPTPPGDPWVLPMTAGILIQETLAAIREAAKSDKLKKSRGLLNQLLQWREWADDAGEEVRAWTSEQLEHEGMPELFAEAFTARGKKITQNNGLEQAELNYSVNRSALKTIIDTELFLKKLAPLTANENVARFLEAWDSASEAPEDPG